MALLGGDARLRSFRKTSVPLHSLLMPQLAHLGVIWTDLALNASRRPCMSMCEWQVEAESEGHQIVVAKVRGTGAI